MSISSDELNQSFFFKHSKFVKAGAGAGKTTLLINSFIDFAIDFKNKNGRWPRVILTTFTRKATQEIKERLLIKALKMERQDLFEFINKKSYVHISTIHSVLSLILSEGYDVIQLPARFKIVDEISWQKQVRRLVKVLFKQKPQYLDLFEQLDLDSLIRYSLKIIELKSLHGAVRPADFTELQFPVLEIVKNLKEDLDLIFQKIPDKNNWPEKWQSFLAFLSQLKSYIDQNDIESFVNLIETPEALPRELKNFALGEENRERIKKFFEKIKNKPVLKESDTDQFIKEAATHFDLLNQFATDLDILIRNKRRLSGEITVQDLEVLTTEILRRSPNVFNEFSERWDFFMIDEFQDTSPIQVKLLEPLLKVKPHFIVGDPQQSIYMFRGARTEVFENRQKYSEQTKIPQVILNTNYRSDPRLMKSINSLVERLGPSFTSMNTKDELSKVVINPEINLYWSNNESKAVVFHIQELLSKGVAPQEICVLSRKNSDLIETARLLRQSGIEVQMSLSKGFQEKREVRDVISFLKFLANPHDNENLISLLRSPWCYFDDQTIFDTLKKDQSHSFWNRFQKHQSLSVPIRTLLKCLDIYYLYGSSRSLRYFVFEHGLLEASNFIDPSGRCEGNIIKLVKDLNDQEKTAGFNLLSFISVYFSQVGDDHSVGESEAVPVIEPDCVSMMTIHAAKGLEFDHVLILGMNSPFTTKNNPDFEYDEQRKLFAVPFKSESEKNQNLKWSQLIVEQRHVSLLAESKRLLYVALTRAKHSLTFMAKARQNKDGWTFGGDSWAQMLGWPKTAEDVFLDSTDLKVQFKIFDEEVESIKKMNPREVVVQPKWSQLNDLNQLKGDLKPEIKVSSVSNLIADPTAQLIAVDQRQNLSQSGVQLKNLFKANKGTRAHQIFEALQFARPEELDMALNDELRAMLDYLHSEKELRFKQILENGHSEWGFGLKIKGTQVIGQIDLWAELNDEVHVLDYKTGSVEQAEKALKQLTIYAAALAQMKMISLNKPLILSAVYVTDQKTISKKFKDVTDLFRQENELLKDFL